MIYANPLKADTMKKLFLLLALLPSLAFAVENDTDLNTIYQKVIKSNDSDLVANVKKSQIVWLKSRNANCKFFSDKKGNDTDLSNECITLENEARIKLLNRIDSLINL